MKTNKEIRLDNTRIVVECFFGGVRRQLALKLGKSPTQISRLFSESEIDGRGIGDVLARQIETACALERGWLDHPHNPSDILDNKSGINTPELRIEYVLRDLHDLIESLPSKEKARTLEHLMNGLIRGVAA